MAVPSQSPRGLVEHLMIRGLLRPLLLSGRFVVASSAQFGAPGNIYPLLYACGNILHNIVDRHPIPEVIAIYISRQFFMILIY